MIWQRMLLIELHNKYIAHNQVLYFKSNEVERMKKKRNDMK